jgi:predicted ATP-binding protein involved in virulence
MELLYLWIEDYKNIQKQGFNFSSQYRFTFDYQEDKDGKVIGGKLKVEENPNHIPDFFPKGISNVTAIIGENGSGKSSVLEYLINEVFDWFWSKQTIYIHRLNNNIILYHESTYKIIYNGKIEIEQKSYQISDISQGRIRFSDPLENVFNNAQFIFYSNTFDFTSIRTYSYSFIKNISTNHLLEQYLNQNEGVKISQVSLFKQEEIKNQIKFFTSEYIHFIPFKIKSKIAVKITNINDNSFKKRLENIKELFKDVLTDDLKVKIDKLDKFFQLTRNEKENYKKRLSLAILENYFNFEEVPSPDERNKNIYQAFWGIEFDKQSPFEAIKNIFNALIKFIPFGIDYYNRICGFIDKIEAIIDLPETSTGPSSLIIDPNSRIFPDDFIKTIEAYFKTTGFESVTIGEYLAFDWGLSSGELSLFSFFSRFYSISNQNGKDLLILVDEGELGLHPQWQKQYLKKLVDFLPQIFPDKQIQIILTSHSPFIASDLPNSNIIFLEKGEGGRCVVKDSLNEMKQTFGANIHTLLTDSFFMKDGLMGDFAKEKINQVIAYLNRENSEMDDDTAQKYIQMIGEPIIRNQLQKMLDSKRLEKVKEIDDIKLEISKLEDRLKKLEGDDTN